MIIWLASYPRSGNRLLRTMLYQTMGLGAYTDRHAAIFPPEAAEKWQLQAPVFDEVFYQEASRSDHVYLVKTHRPPRDGQPALYIVRDGRKSCLSYLYFHQRETAATSISLLDILLGRDIFGSWSAHYRAWAARGNFMLLRYEDLVGASEELLRKIAQFIGHSGLIRPWVNNFEAERLKAPSLVREGRVAWEGNDPRWNTMVDAVFFHLHGDLMVELGYVDDETRAQRCAVVPHGWSELIDTAGRFLGEYKAAQGVCDERQVIIGELKKACDERLELIQKLSR